MSDHNEELVGPGGYDPVVTEVVVVGAYRVRVTFSDGAVREVDLGSIARENLTEPWENHDYFVRVFVDRDARTITWPNGFDIDPCWLYEAHGPPGLDPAPQA